MKAKKHKLTAILAAAGLGLFVCAVVFADPGTETGIADDLTVFGTDGTVPDPDLEVKGFSVFGSTDLITHISTAPGNVVINGALEVSSDVYVVGNSTFAWNVYVGQNNLYVAGGSAGQLLKKNSGGWLEWTDGGALGDNLGSHIATTTLQMGVYGINTSSDITAANYQIGGSTVMSASNATYNTVVGFRTAKATSSTYITALGYNAGYSNTTGGINIFLGSNSGYGNTSGSNNTVVGAGAAYFNATGGENVFVGNGAGYNNPSGGGNTVVGRSAGNGASSNAYSSTTLMGYRAGYALTTGSDNILLGWQSGYNVTSGTGNIVIGYNKNTSAAAANNELNIGGVLYGDLSAKTIGISTRIPQAALDVVSTGTAANQLAQIWRNTATGIVSSMSATGVMMATKFIGDGSGLSNLTGTGDNLGNHIATTTLNMANMPIVSVSSINLNAFGLAGSAPVLQVAGSIFTINYDGKVGIGTANPDRQLTIYTNTNFPDMNLSVRNLSAGNTATAGYDLHNNEGTGYLWVGSSNYIADPIGQSQLILESDFKNGLGLASLGGGPINFYTADINSPKLTVTNAGAVGISTGLPQGALDIVAGGSTPSDMATIWRNSSGVVVGSMTATGQLAAAAVRVVSSVNGNYTAYIATSATAGIYSVAVASNGVTNINNLVIENRISDPVSPVTGQIWLKVN